jgi:hypothetical protein
MKLTITALLLTVQIAAACATVNSSAVSTGPMQAGPWSGQVTISALQPPDPGTELGIVQTSGAGATVEKLLSKFVDKVRELGGNYGYIDTISSKYELIHSTQTYTYSCGTTQAPRTCTGVRQVTNEVRTTQIVGRAFLVEAKP